MNDKNNNKNNNSSKKKPEDLDNKINNILKKDTAPMFNMFKNNTFNSFNTMTPKTPSSSEKTTKPSMEKITMNSHRKPNPSGFHNAQPTHPSNPGKPGSNTYMSSLEKIIKKFIKIILIS